MAAMRPSRTRTRSTPVMSTRAPVGSKPMKLPGPAKVARARQLTAARSSSVMMSRTSKRQSGKASNSSAKKATISSRPTLPVTPWISAAASSA
jgi:hypothetical protein